MKGMFRKALAGVAAAALAATGLAAVSGSAMAAEYVNTTETIRVTASESGQLTGHTLTFYRIGRYVDYGDDVYEIDTVDEYEDLVRAAVNTAVDPDVDVDEDPLATVMSRDDEDSGSLDDSTVSPYTGSTRTFVDYLEDNGIARIASDGNVVTVTITSDMVQGSDGSYYVDVEVPAGIYAIYDTSGSNASVAMMIGTAPVYVESGVATINLKNQSTPSAPEKTVTGTADGDSVTVGDVLTFEVTAENVSDPSAYGDDYYFSFVDTPGTGLTVDPATAGFEINGTSITSDSLAGHVTVGGLDETLVGDGETSFTVTLDKTAVQSLLENSVDLVLTYQATVNGDAEGAVTNTASVDNNGATSENGTATVYTYGFTLKKVNADDTALEGATFIVMKDGQYLVQNDDGTWSFTSDRNSATPFTTPEGGVLEFDGLEAGDYEVIETSNPDGYLDDYMADFTVTISATDKQGGYSVDITSNSHDLASLEDGVIEVLNVRSISELPQTGAAGIALFVVIGVLIAGAGVTVYMKSRSVRNAMRA